MAASPSLVMCESKLLASRLSSARLSDGEVGPALQRSRLSSKRSLLNIVILAAGFSLVEAAVLGVMGIAGSINQELGYYMNGTLYISFSVSFLVAPAIVTKRGLGAKWGLVVGCGLYSTFLCAQIYPAWYTLIPGAAIGGLGSALCWTSEGKYLTLTAADYAINKDLADPGGAMGLFNGMFLAINGTILVLGQAFSSLILSLGEDDSMKTVLFVIYAILAIVSTIVLGLALPDMNRQDEFYSSSDTSRIDDVTPVESLSLAFSATLRNLKDPKSSLMIPSNVAFGLMSSFQYGYFATMIVSPNLGVESVGIVGAIAAAVMAILSFPMGKVSDVIGREPIMALGFIACTAAACICLLWEPTASWAVISLISVLIGIENAVWGCINAAVTSEFFRMNPAPAFANLKLWSGLATSISYFVFTSGDDSEVQLSLIIGFAVIGIIGYFAADRKFKREKLGQVKA